VLDGKLIRRNALPDYPDAILYKICPEGIKLNGHTYAGAIYFYSSKHSALPDPYAKDPTAPCYLTKFDTSKISVFNATEIMPKPYGGETTYLKNLALSMGVLPQKARSHLTSDSITVRFILTASAMLTGLESIVPSKPEHAQILEAIKRNSCLWSAGKQSGIPRITKRKMTILYSVDQNGNIRSLDTLEYR